MRINGMPRLVELEAFPKIQLILTANRGNWPLFVLLYFNRPYSTQSDDELSSNAIHRSTTILSPS